MYTCVYSKWLDTSTNGIPWSRYLTYNYNYTYIPPSFTLSLSPSSSLPPSLPPSPSPSISPSLPPVIIHALPRVQPEVDWWRGYHMKTSASSTLTHDMHHTHNSVHCLSRYIYGPNMYVHVHNRLIHITVTVHVMFSILLQCVWIYWMNFAKRSVNITSHLHGRICKRSTVEPNLVMQKKVSWLMRCQMLYKYTSTVLGVRKCVLFREVSLYN